MTISIRQSSKGIDNGVEENPADNMSLHTEIEGEDIKEQKKRYFSA